MRTSAAPSRLVARSSDLRVIAADAVRVVRISAHGLSERERQLLDDLGRGRYLTGVFKFVEIAKRCEDPLHAAWFAERLRGFVLADHPAISRDVDLAFRDETVANGDANLAQHDYRVAPTRANRERAIDALLRQDITTHAAIDALHRDAGRACHPLGLIRAGGVS